MPKVVPVSDDDYARQKRELEARAVTAVVTGDQPVRDCVSRDSMHKGQTVRIDPDNTIVEHLVRAGAIRLQSKASAEG